MPLALPGSRGACIATQPRFIAVRTGIDAPSYSAGRLVQAGRSSICSLCFLWIHYGTASIEKLYRFHRRIIDDLRWFFDSFRACELNPLSNAIRKKLRLNSRSFFSVLYALYTLTPASAARFRRLRRLDL